MGKRVKSVSMPGLAAQLEKQSDLVRTRRYLWKVRRVVEYVRANVINTVEIIAIRDAWNPTGWEGVVAKATLDDDGLVSGYEVQPGVPYTIGKELDKAWGSFQ